MPILLLMIAIWSLGIIVVSITCPRQVADIPALRERPLEYRGIKSPATLVLVEIFQA